MVRRCLAKRVRPRLDSVDLTQAVWGSFFIHSIYDYDFQNPAQLVAFLTRVAENKTRRVNQQYLDTQKNDIKRETSLSELAAEDEGEPVDPRAGPAEAAQRRDELDRELSGVPESIRPAIRLLRQGAAYAEVAAALRVPERLLRRVLDEARRRHAVGA